MLRTAARENMLARFAKVTLEGKYIPPPPANSKVQQTLKISCDHAEVDLGNFTKSSAASQAHAMV